MKSCTGNHRVQQPRNKGHHGKSKKDTMMRKSRSSPSHLLHSKSLDDDDDEYSDAYQTISIQLLDLMHTLHTRAASIFKGWDKNEDKHEKEVCKNDVSMEEMYQSNYYYSALIFIEEKCFI